MKITYHAPVEGKAEVTEVIDGYILQVLNTMNEIANTMHQCKQGIPVITLIECTEEEKKILLHISLEYGRQVDGFMVDDDHEKTN